MSEPIECIPNFSEARRPEVIQAIVEAITTVPRVRVLDVSSDLDRNRTVVTFVGDSAAVETGAFAGIAKAAELIDLDQHTGAHPRIGATDVVPFVPLRHATLDDCVTLARRLGERVGRELKIPVYLYEAAATRPERQNLENIRHGQYEGLQGEIGVNPDRQPDFGPLHLGKAGATAIGARPFLVAYNVYLNTPDIDIAKKVARAVRHSSGGLRYVKALGLLVAGGATWVSFHRGGGVGIGYSQHAGQVIVADGTPKAARRLERVLTTDPGLGIVRHADAGYPETISAARRHGLKIPMLR